MSSPPNSRPSLRSALSVGGNSASPTGSFNDGPAPPPAPSSAAAPAPAGGGAGAHIHFPQGLAPDGKEAAAGTGGGKSGFRRTRTMSSDLGKGFKPKGQSSSVCGGVARCSSSLDDRGGELAVRAAASLPSPALVAAAALFVLLELTVCLPLLLAAVGFDTFDDSSDDALFSFTLQGAPCLPLPPSALARTTRRALPRPRGTAGRS